MKKTIKQICCVIVGVAATLCFFRPIVGKAAEETEKGTVYYFSSTEGDDTNSGLSPEEPFQNLAKAEELNLKAGDQLLFKRGDIWYGTVTLDLNGGSKENPIVISAYGDEEEERPSFRYYKGHVQEGVEAVAMVLRNTNGVEISDIMVGYANAGIRFEYDTLNNKYLRITNCHFHDIYGVTQFDYMPLISFSCGMYWRWVGEDSYDPEVDGFTVEEVYVDKCTAYDAGSLTGYTSGVKDFYMTECVAEYNGYYGTVVTATGGYIDRCVFKNNGTRSMPPGSCGIMISANDFTIKNSIIADQQRQGDDPDGCGIDFEWRNRNITVDNCLFEGNAGVGIMFFTSGNDGSLGENVGTNYDCVVKNCKFVNNNTNIGNIGGYEIFAVNAGCDGCVVEDNEYVIDYSTDCETVSFSLLNGENNCELENNVQVDAIAENYNPLIISDDSDVEAEEESNASEVNETDVQWPPYVLYLLGIGEGLVLVLVIVVIMLTIRRKRGAVNEEN